MQLLNLINKFHNLSWITEINELFHNILIYWDAPVLYILQLYICIQGELDDGSLYLHMYVCDQTSIYAFYLYPLKQGTIYTDCHHPLHLV